MNTTISFAVSHLEAIRTRRLAKCRGFATTSEYVRFLLSSDDEALISEEEVLRRSKDADRLHATGKLVKAKSLAAIAGQV